MALTKFRVGAFDLGSKNTAFALWLGGRKLIIKRAFMVPPTLLDLKEPAFEKQMRSLRKALRKILIKYKPKEIMAERYMNRGIKGVQVEILGILLGCLATLAIQQKIKLRLVTASTWKNQINRKHPGFLDRMYSYFPQSKRHRVDAILIGLYAIDKTFPLKEVKKVERYIAKMEGSYGEPRAKRTRKAK